MALKRLAPAIDAHGSILLSEIFLLKERQRIINLFMILFLNAFSQLAHHFFLVNLRAFGRFLPGW
jgi:hypothetical protein